MPDVLDPADSGRGDCSLIEARASRIVEKASGEPRASSLEPRSSIPLLLFDRVTKWYGPVIGVNQVTLELRGGITGLVGTNGAGKSTLMRLATGQLLPSLGRVFVQGHDAWSARAKRRDLVRPAGTDLPPERGRA